MEQCLTAALRTFFVDGTSCKKGRAEGGFEPLGR
jgi:hypothetical protein